MARPFPLPCEPEMKWVFKAGIKIDPATLAKNLTILCTVAFSATVLYVMYSNSKRPQYTQYTQVSHSDDEELSDEDHTIQCTTRCRHSIFGNSNRSRPPDRLMNFGIPLDDVPSPSSRRTYYPLDSTVDINMARTGLGDESLRSTDTMNVQIQPSTASCMASDPIATNDVNTSVSVTQDDNSLKSCGIDDAETRTSMHSIVASALNSSAVCGIDNAETQTTPGPIMASVLNASSDVGMAAEAFVDGALSNIESLFTQVQPSNISTASGPDVVGTQCTEIQPSTSTNAASGAKVFESSCTQTLPPTTSTASGPDVTAAGRLDDTCLCSGFTKDPDFTRAKVGFLRNFEESGSPVRIWEELDAIHCDSMEKDDNGESHFEGYIHGIIREKGSKSYKRRLYGGVSFAKERREQGDGGCSREKIDLGGSAGVRFQEAGTQLESGVEVCETVSIEKPHKIVEGIRKMNLDSVSSQDGCVNTLSREYRPRHRDSCTQTEVKKKGTNMSADSLSASSSKEGCPGRPLKQLHTTTKDETRHLLGNNFECRDKGIGNFVDSYSASNNCKKACMGRPLKQLPTMAKEETRQVMLGNNFEKCRDQGTSTSVDTYPESRTRRAWTGRPFKQTCTVPKEEACHSIDNNFGVVERCVEERREGGITSMQPEPLDPLKQAKSSLETLTETEHWSKMSLPEQYECLGLLDSTLAAASAEWKGKRNGTYWRLKDSAPPSKLSGLSFLCKPQGSTECPNVDKAHLHFQKDVNCTNVASSTSRQVEQFCAEVTCIEAQKILQDKQVHRALPQGNHQLSSLSATGDSLFSRTPWSAQNSLHDESNRRAKFSAETRRLQSEAARETRTLSKLLARNSKNHYM